MMIRHPDTPESHGRKTDALVELVDLLPTVAAALDVPLPAGDTYPVDGSSLMPLLRNPHARIKDVALSMFPRLPSASPHQKKTSLTSMMFSTNPTRCPKPRLDDGYLHNTCIHDVG